MLYVVNERWKQFNCNIRNTVVTQLVLIFLLDPQQDTMAVEG